MPDAWLLWEKSRLLGVYASEDVAEDQADDRREHFAAALGRHGVHLRTERWDLIDYPIRDVEERRDLRRNVAEAAARWAMLDEDDALLPVQDANWDRYLMVPHEGRLRFPAFQFKARGEPLSGVRDLLRVLRDAGPSDSHIFLWFTTDGPGGEPPAEQLAANPERVIASAEERAGRATD